MEIPKKLRNIKPVVKNLYFRGKWEEAIFEKCIAVVGSRKMTGYGQRVVEKIVPGFVESGVTVVSGFMYGVDQAAHKETLACGGKAIAVLGWGIEWEVPDEDKKLYKEIENKGLIVSEYEGDTKPQLWMFPQRNRIIAGLSDAVLVVEASEGSGSLITADWALKYKRKLFAVPGPITSSVSSGTNNLIKSGQAKMATSADDILKPLGWKPKPTGMIPVGGQGILGLLENEPLTVDEIARKLGRRVEDVGIELSELELKGLIKEADGQYFRDHP